MGAKAEFEAEKSTGTRMNNWIYNALLDAGVEGQVLKATEN